MRRRRAVPARWRPLPLPLPHDGGAANRRGRPPGRPAGRVAGADARALGASPRHACHGRPGAVAGSGAARPAAAVAATTTADTHIAIGSAAARRRGQGRTKRRPRRNAALRTTVSGEGRLANRAAAVAAPHPTPAAAGSHPRVAATPTNAPTARVAVFVRAVHVPSVPHRRRAAVGGGHPLGPLPLL